MNDSNFPNQIYQGDSISFDEYFSDYLPSENWTMSYYLTNGTDKIIIDSNKITVDLITNKYNVLITSSQSLLFIPGYYNLNVIFNNSVSFERKTILLKSINILQDLITGANIDNRFWAEIALENVQLYMQNKANMKQKLYKIADREVQSYSFKEFTDLISYLRYEIAQNKQLNSKKGNSKIYVQFTNK